MDNIAFTRNFLFSTQLYPRRIIYNLRNFRQIPQLNRLSEEKKFEMEVVGHIFPFKANSFVVENLIDWDNIDTDPMFAITFPCRDMLSSIHYEKIEDVILNGSSSQKINETVNEIRSELNPFASGQLKYNIPFFEGVDLMGIQHKYKETVLFFPAQGQTCFAYCSFCFRWAEMAKMDNIKFELHEGQMLIKYLLKHPEVTDILITGGDPLIIKTKDIAIYIRDILQADLPNLHTIRIGTKALSYWPYRFLTDIDSAQLLDLFREIVKAEKHLSIMAHFNHPNELKNSTVCEAIKCVRETGAEIRTQSPILAHINDQAKIWEEMWKEQVKLGCIPYYMFIARNTGAQHHFGVSLHRAWQIFTEAYQNVSGLARTVRGPSMSTIPGKIQILGVNEIKGERVFNLQFLQGRNPDWVRRPFFAKFDENAKWLNDLKPAFGKKKFFFEEDLL